MFLCRTSERWQTRYWFELVGWSRSFRRLAIRDLLCLRWLGETVRCRVSKNRRSRGSANPTLDSINRLAMLEYTPERPVIRDLLATLTQWRASRLATQRRRVASMDIRGGRRSELLMTARSWRHLAECAEYRWLISLTGLSFTGLQ